MKNLNPEKVGFDPVRLGNIDALLRGYVEGGLVAGCALRIIRHGEIAYDESFGYADI